MKTRTFGEVTLTSLYTHIHLIGSMIYIVCFPLLFYPLTRLQILIIFHGQFQGLKPSTVYLHKQYDIRRKCALFFVSPPPLPAVHLSYAGVWEKGIRVSPSRIILEYDRKSNKQNKEIKILWGKTKSTKGFQRMNMFSYMDSSSRYQRTVFIPKSLKSRKQ